MLKDILEFVSPSMAEARVDSDQMVIRGCVLFGSKESRNNYTYSEKAVESLHKLAGGSKVYIDHESADEKKARQGVRSMHDYAGVISNVQRKGDKILGDWNVVESYWPLAKSIAAQLPDRVGFSIACKAYTNKENGNKEVVEDLHSLSSIDLVSEGAVIANLFEALDERNRAYGIDARESTESESPKTQGRIVAIRESEIVVDAGVEEPVYYPKRKLSFIPRVGQRVSLNWDGTTEKRESNHNEEEDPMTKSLEEFVLNAARRSGHRECGAERYVDENLPDEAESNVDLTEQTLLGAVNSSRGATRSQRPTDIDEFKSPESKWTVRLKELKAAGKPAPKVETEEDEVLRIVTRK